MNPLGGLVILLGLIVIVIGLNGSQHKVADALRNARPGGTPQANTTGAGRSGVRSGGNGAPTASSPAPGLWRPLTGIQT